MKKYSIGCAVVALMTAWGPALAQESDGMAANASGSDFGVIVVTALKREENVQEIPKSVQVVGSQELQNNNITDISDLKKLVPSMSGAGLSIRGVASNASTIGAQGKVGLVLDDVPQPSRASLANNLLDIERVEVLPGPQGTLSGRNATGGLINMVTRNPTYDWTGTVTATATTDDQFILGGYISGPISDTLAFSVSGYHNHFRGLSRNAKTGNWASSDTSGGRAKLRWEPDDRLSVTLTGFYQRQISRMTGGTAYQVYSHLSIPQEELFSAFDIETPRRSFAVLKPGLEIGPDNIEFYSEHEGKGIRTDWGGILRIDYEVGDATISSITSYLNEKNPNTQPFNGITTVNTNYRPEYDGFAYLYDETDYKTQEIRIASSTNSKLQYVAGIFYSSNLNTYDYERYVFPVSWERDFGQESMAVFGNLSYELPTRTVLRGGLRYEADKINYNWLFNPILATSKTTESGVVIDFPDVNQKINTSANHKQDFVNYDLGIQQFVGEDIMFYATYGKASQGPIYDAEDNSVAVQRPLEPLPSEKVRSLEIGVKSQFFDRRVTFNLNYFNAKYDNYQVQTITYDTNDPSAVPVFKLAAVGKVQTQGVEAALSAAITDHMRLVANVSYTDAVILDFPYATCYTGQTLEQGCVNGIPPGEVSPRGYQENLAGSPLASTPKWKLVLNPSFDYPINDDVRVFANATLSYQSSQNTDLLGNPANDLAATTRINASAGVGFGAFRIEGFVNNLTKEIQETYGTTIAGFALPAGATVRTRNLSRDNTRYFGVRVRADF